MYLIKMSTVNKEKVCGTRNRGSIDQWSSPLLSSAQLSEIWISIATSFQNLPTKVKAASSIKEWETNPRFCDSCSCPCCCRCSYQNFNVATLPSCLICTSLIFISVWCNILQNDSICTTCSEVVRFTDENKCRLGKPTCAEPEMLPPEEELAADGSLSEMWTPIICKNGVR